MSFSMTAEAASRSVDCNERLMTYVVLMIAASSNITDIILQNNGEDENTALVNRNLEW